jgi:DNA (cytosine-5)-methyltransferase 1
MPLADGGRWPRAARFDGGRRFAVGISPFPEIRHRPPLHDFLVHCGKPLSARATRGFLARTERGSLRFVDGFRERLRDHLASMERALVPLAAE